MGAVGRGIGRFAASGLLLGLIGYFAAHALTGDQGIVAWLGYKSELVRLTEAHAELANVRANLETRAERLRERSLDLDYLEERARALAGVAHPSDVIVPANALPYELRAAGVDDRRGRR